MEGRLAAYRSSLYFNQPLGFAVTVVAYGTE